MARITIKLDQRRANKRGEYPIYIVINRAHLRAKSRTASFATYAANSGRPSKSWAIAV